jgi:hypothetical protein
MDLRCQVEGGRRAGGGGGLDPRFACDKLGFGEGMRVRS